MSEHVAVYEQCEVVYEQTEDGGWRAFLPDIPDVVALGATREKAAAMLDEVLAAYAEEEARKDRALLAVIDAARPRPKGLITGSRPRRLTGATVALHD